MSALIPMAMNDYATWLERHVAQGGRITHAYDYPFRSMENMMFRAVRDFRTGGECGADAVRILPATGVRHLGGDLGHNVIFPLDGGSCRWVPVYTDSVFENIPGVAEAYAERRRREVERLAREAESDIARRMAVLGSDVPARRFRTDDGPTRYGGDRL